MADIFETVFVNENLLDNECSDGSAELLSSLHDSETEWDDFGLHEERDRIGVLPLDESSNNSQARNSEVFEWLTLVGGV